MYRSQTVWITGAGSGIGRALALTYAQKGYSIILSGRRRDALDAVASECAQLGNGKHHVLTLDLTNPTTIGYAVKAAKLEFDQIDVLINNGGVSQRSTVMETPIEVDRQIFETNYFGAVQLTKAVLPWMIESGGGHIVSVSSISGLFGFPLRSAYSASKHAIVGFTETLGLELGGHNIHTTIAFPGRIRTEISKSALTADGTAQNSMDAGLAGGMDVMKCAQKLVKAVERKRRRVLIGRKELLMVCFHKYLPSLFWRIASKINPR